MTEFDQHLLALFHEAKTKFYEREIANILNGVSERNLCGRLAIYLENLLDKYKVEEYFADPEYNRQQNGEVKTMLDDNAVVTNICCDVIVHSRGQIPADDNLIAVEMKKANRPEEKKLSDQRRVRILSKSSYDGVWSADGVTLPEHVCGYHLGIYFEIDIDNRESLFHLYHKGELINQWAEVF